MRYTLFPRPIEPVRVTLTKGNTRDFNTRFSGIHPDKYATGAVLTLESVRRALGRLIGTDTILIGHALDNDLRALRLVHQSVIDTAALFPHSRGLPYRRALRDL